MAWLPRLVGADVLLLAKPSAGSSPDQNRMTNGHRPPTLALNCSIDSLEPNVSYRTAFASPRSFVSMSVLSCASVPPVKAVAA